MNISLVYQNCCIKKYILKPLDYAHLTCYVFHKKVTQSINQSSLFAVVLKVFNCTNILFVMIVLKKQFTVVICCDSLFAVEYEPQRPYIACIDEMSVDEVQLFVTQNIYMVFLLEPIHLSTVFNLGLCGHSINSFLILSSQYS